MPSKNFLNDEAAPFIEPTNDEKDANTIKLESWLKANGIFVSANHFPWSPSLVCFCRQDSANCGFYIRGFDNNPLKIYDACCIAIDAYNFEYSSYEDYLENERLEDTPENEKYYDNFKDLGKLVGAFFTIDELDELFEIVN